VHRHPLDALDAERVAKKNSGTAAPCGCA
jgi:hypothetical protein